MAAGAKTPTRYESSTGELSSPPSGSLSDPRSPPTSVPHRLVSNITMDNDQGEIVVHDGPPLAGSPSQNRQITFQQYTQPSDSPTNTASGRAPPQKRFDLIDGKWVQLTAAGVPRKKPGRKPGTVVKPKTTDGTEPKVRKPRKPRDPDAPPIQRKRKLAPAEEGHEPGQGPPQTGSTASPSQHSQHLGVPDLRGSPKMPKREGYPSSMQSILNDDPPPPSTAPARSSGLSYDPIRGNYDPIRETMSSKPYSSSGSPRAALGQTANRSPSIASLIEPVANAQTSPGQSHNLAGRLHATESSSIPPSPSFKPTSNPVSRGVTASEARKDGTTSAPGVVINQANFTTIANGPVKKPATGFSTPKTDNMDEFAQDREGRWILDFGKARPGEEFQAPTIMLNIPIKAGETNKYVNFMRLAEDRYGWDALHPRLAANRDRKARIAAATATLEKAEMGRESGDEMSLDSDVEGSNQETGAASGPDAQVKPKKKRNFKEDQYDVEDDFVDDSEMLWEAQAAASRDGFFVYSGPLVPEIEKPKEERPKRGRGRGSRGGRGSTRGAGTGRGGGPGSRGGAVTRKPRITKAERLQREREKAERESMAQINKTPTNGYVLHPTTPATFSVGELGA